MQTAEGPTGRWRRLRRKLVKRCGRGGLRAISRLFARQSLIGDQPVFAKSVLPWTARFEADWLKIRAELDAVLLDRARLPAFHDISPDQHRVSKGDNWKVFPLYVFGDRFAPNCERCPETDRLLSEVPALRNAMFSILAPHYRIPPHQGPTNGVIRIHLGLRVPRDDAHCRIRVDGEIFGWREGECVVFDDFYEHEVWNDTDEERVVLFFDVDRPMKALGRVINRIVIAAMKRSAYVQDAKRNLRGWGADPAAGHV